MSKKSITKNYLYNLSYQILVLLLPIITIPYVSRVLGAEAIGIYSYTLSITTYFILLGSLGIALYGQREIAYHSDNKEKRTQAFWEIFLLRCITMTITAIIFYCTFATQGEYALYYKILVLELVANCLDISWFFQGLEEFKKTVLRNVFVKILSIVCIFVFVKSPEDLVIYFIIYAAAIALGNLSLWLYVPKYIQKIRIKTLNLVQHIKPTIALFIPQIATQIYTVLDKTMIGMIIPDKSEVGYYEQAQKIIKMLLTIITSLGTVMIPRMAHTYIKGETEKLKSYMKQSFQFVWIFSIPIMLGIISISEKFVPLFFGPGYEKVVLLMSIVSPIIVIIGLSNVIGTQFLLPTKRQKAYTISVVMGAIVNFILNLILIRSHASIGASVATVVAEIVVTGIQLYCIRKEIPILEILKLSKNYIIAGICMFIGSVGVGMWINDNFLSIVAQVLTGMLIYFVLLILLKDAFLGKILEKIKRKGK